MTFIRGILLVGVCCILFAISGGLVAIVCNWAIPGYYSGVFPSAHKRGDLAATAVTVGVGQGILFGFIVGSILALGLGRYRQLQINSATNAVAVVGIFGFVFAIGGAAIGFGIGAFSPGYYRRVFGSGKEPDFNPIDVGIGMGLSEGLMIGVFVGALFAVFLARRKFRRSKDLTIPDDLIVE